MTLNSVGNATFALNTAGNTINLTGQSGNYTVNGVGAGNDTITGGDNFDTISGGGGNDLINGREGSDSLTGGAGNDTFLFDTGPNPTNIDVIQDFNVAADTIQLDNAVFAALGADGALDPSLFGIGNAAEGDERLFYDDTTGELFYDADGTGAGAAVQIASLDPSLALTSNDFFVV